VSAEAQTDDEKPQDETPVEGAAEAPAEGDAPVEEATEEATEEEAPAEEAEPEPEPVPLAFRALPPLRGHDGSATAVAYAPGGQWFLTGGADSTVRKFDAITLQETDVMIGHAGSVSALAISSDEKFFASASEDKTVRLWDNETLQVKFLFRGFTEAVSGVAFSPDGSQIVACSLDGTARVWDTSKGKEQKVIENEQPLASVAWHPGGTRVMLGASNSVIHPYDADKWKPDGKPFKGSHGNWVSSVAFSANGKLMASGSLDSSVARWDQKKGKEQAGYKGGRMWVQAVQCSPEGDYLFAASRDGTVSVFSVADGEEPVEVLEGRGAPINDIAVFPRGTRLAAVCEDGTIQVFAMQGMEWADWSPGGGAVVVEEEESASSGPNPKYYPDGKFDYMIWKADQ
jgi:WD40 repeat protein